MTKKEIEGAYAAPELKSLCFHCEEGFAQSLTIDGFTPTDGVWDDESNDF
jgi:hypothetical protein